MTGTQFSPLQTEVSNARRAGTLPLGVLCCQAPLCHDLDGGSFMTKFLIGALAALFFVSGSMLVAQTPAEETETVWVLTYTNGGG